jgi:DNA-binding transcriptional regulator LsrR (DeoR family)
MTTPLAPYQSDLRDVGEVRLRRLVARLAAGATQSEIARDLGVSRQAVHKLVVRARERGLL